MTLAPPYCSVHPLGDVTVVRVASHARIIGFDTFPILREEVLALRRQTGAKKLVLNLEPVEYLHSLAIAFLLTLHRELQQDGGALRICGIQPEVEEALTVTQASATLDLRSNEESALEAI